MSRKHLFRHVREFAGRHNLRIALCQNVPAPGTSPVAASAPMAVARPRAPACLRRAFLPASWTPRRALMRDMDTPKAARRRLAERGDSPSAHASAAHPRILWVCPPRSIPSGRCLKALPQSERRCRTVVTFSNLEVYHGFVRRSVLGEDLAAAALAGVGPFVGESLDLSGDESYSSHGRELLSWGVWFTQLYQDFPPYFSPTVSGDGYTGIRQDNRI